MKRMKKMGGLANLMKGGLPGLGGGLPGMPTGRPGGGFPFGKR